MPINHANYSIFNYQYGLMTGSDANYKSILIKMLILKQNIIFNYQYGLMTGSDANYKSILIKMLILKQNIEPSKRHLLLNISIFLIC